MSQKQQNYPDVNPNPNFAELEQGILAEWEKNDTFKKSISNREGAEEFIFYDGPPFANGLPHYGHLLTGYVKDVFARYQTQLGKKVERNFGWDCHGLPAEMGAEKELEISGRAAIKDFGIDKFNDQCRSSVMEYSGEWEKYVNRQARWVDFENDYKTMDKDFMESVMWAFKQLFDKGLIYEAMRVMPYSWAAETPLSNFETKLDNSYRERADKSATVAFELEDGRKVLAWTTTPWTLPSNLALAVNPEMDYVVVNNRITGASSVSKLTKDIFSGETDRLRFEDITQQDESLITELLSDSEVASGISRLLKNPDVKQAFEDYANENKKADLGFKKIYDKENNEFVGYCGLFEKEDKKLVLGYALHKKFWGKGFATEAATYFCSIAFHKHKAKTVYAYVCNNNQASKSVIDKLGFEFAEDAQDRPNTSLYQRQANGTIKGSDLVGLTYKPLFPYFAGRKNCFKILSADFVEEGEGTGIVHIAPGFGEDDQIVGDNAGIELVCPVDSAGKFTAEVPDYEGLNVFDANEKIIQRLKEEGKLIKQEQYLHNYPHCWRTDEPLIYRAMPSWYVEVTKFKDRMVELNKDVNWMPGHVRDGLFGKWLEGARDWSISRNRFWGAPIPIWRSPTGKLICVGSIEELQELSGQEVKDLHRPYIDNVTIERDGEVYTRVEDVLDCWFESGSMPYASQGKCELPQRYPADFIVEYTAQTRGWFYTMTVLGVALFDEMPFKNVICHGVVLGEPEKDPSTGKMVKQKLSKSKKNYPDPLILFNEYGSDALRWFMLSSPIMRGGELEIDKEGKFIRDVIRLYIKPIWNAYNFFTLYANADGLKAERSFDSENLMDKYILAKCSEAVETIRAGMDAYDTPAAYEAIEQFFEVLNNWYIRRSKDRFWKEEQDADKQAAYDTLYTVLVTMCEASASLLPLVTEEIFTKLTGEESVHLSDFPQVSCKDDSLVANMDKVRDVCNAGLSIRSAANVRVRQPLAKLTVIGANLTGFESIVADELNVKSVEFIEEMGDHAEHKLKIHFPVLGKRLPEKMKQIIPASKQGKWSIENGELVILDEKLLPEEYELLLDPKNPENSAALASQDALVVLDLEISDELKNEGLARDIVRMVQQARKDADLNITDKIVLTLETEANVVDFKAYIAEQTLAASIEISTAKGEHLFENSLDDKIIKIGFNVA